jgi:hypothetical protein
MTQSEALWLLILWVLWAALLFGGLLGKPDAERTRRMPRWTRMISSFVLVVAAWSFALIHSTSAYISILGLVALGMTLGFVGDLFMAKLFLRDDRAILGGIGSFALGHVAYIIAFFMLLSRSQALLDWRMGYSIAELDITLPDPALRWLALLICWVIGALAWYGVVCRPAKERSTLHLAALPYALLLATTLGAALCVTLYAWDLFSLANATQAPRADLLLARGLSDMIGTENRTAAINAARTAVPALGALLFLISDLILAARLFNQLYFRWIDDWVWLTYGPGQMLIVFGVGMLIGSSQ